MSQFLGDYAVASVVYGKFTTYRPSTGASFTLGGTPALSVYKDNSTTQSTTGVTLTADFDSVTGFNHFTIDTSADGTFYSSGSFFQIVITTGTVDSVSVTGTVVGSFTLGKFSSASTVADAVLTAMNTTTFAEPGQASPAATTTLVAKIGYLYKNWRNRKTQTSTTWSLYNDDAVTVDQKATVADDGTTGSKTEIATGP